MLYNLLNFAWMRKVGENRCNNVAPSDSHARPMVGMFHPMNDIDPAFLSELKTLILAAVDKDEPAGGLWSQPGPRFF